ncbi:hypothetical protein Goklo_026346 [Gossypium klotzschianum]|uniref:Uncharacterized protein n=1 Tax=Gossypium klotzschianum TaxID=34286 RepID=A0A7J8TUH5_9ROSI|nr:hypothetical protein [Gossypium klotzschianum]
MGKKVITSLRSSLKFHEDEDDEDDVSSIAFYVTFLIVDNLI